jgi:leucyl aminopeptidase
MEFSIREDAATGFATQALVVPVAEADAPTGTAAEVDGATGGNLADAMARKEFRGKKGDALSVTAPAGTAFRRVLFCGVGKTDALTPEALRKAAGGAARALVRTRFENAAVAPLAADAPFGPVSIEAGTEAWVEGMTLGTYRFSEYKTDVEEREPDRLAQVTLLVPPGTDRAAAERGVTEAVGMCEGVRLAIDLSNHPSAVVTPTRLAEEARRVADAFGLRLEVLERDQMEQMGMGGMIGVSQGSAEPPKFIVLEYNGTGDKDGAPVVLVGKSITFDTGGISIKPAQGMEEMKGDMAGGAAVLGTMHAVARLRLPVHVIGILTAAENMPSGTAQNPGDVLHMLSGLTVEVINTDAEGRLVLADGLAYAQRFTPRAVVDIATLTGACVVALGHEAVGMMGNDDDLKAIFTQVGNETGERVWELPLWDEYMDSIKSDIADLKNTGGRAGGTITAAMFLSKFVGEFPWVHLDIASTAWVDKAGDYLPKGSTGVGVRLMTGFVRRLAETSG